MTNQVGAVVGNIQHLARIPKHLIVLRRKFVDLAGAQSENRAGNAQRRRGTVDPDEASSSAGTVNIEGDVVVAQRGGGLRHDGNRSAIIKRSGANLEVKLINAHRYRDGCQETRAAALARCLALPVSSGRHRGTSSLRRPRLCSRDIEVAELSRGPMVRIHLSPPVSPFWSGSRRTKVGLRVA